MAFLTSYRAEKVYFEKLRSNIDIAKSYIQRGATDEVMALLQNAVDADGAIMLCYRNLGEVWADLAAQLEKTQKALEDLKTALEEYHDDLNKKIDEINNYLVRLINALDERVTILENESKVKFAYLNHDSVEDVYSIEYNGETADFDTLSAALEYPHLLVLIDNENGNIYYPRSVSDVLIDFHADGVSGTDYVDISITMSDSDVVTVTEKTVVNYTFGTGFNVSNTNEVTPDLTVLQAKLSAGFGIEIDSSNEISVDTSDVQEKLIAGQNITLTPDVTDPTKTVIDAAGGASYTPGKGILIESDVIKNNFLTEYNVPIKLTQVGPNIKTIGALCDFNAKTGYYSEITTDTPVNDNANNTIGPGSFKYFNADYLKIECGIPFNNWDLTQTDEHIIFDGFLQFNLKRHGSGNLAQIFECPLYIPVYYELNLDGTTKFVSNSKYFYIRPLCELYGDIITATSWFYYTYRTVGRIYCNGEPINSNNFNNLSTALQTHLNSFISSSGGQKIFLTPYKRDTYL